MSDKSTKEEGLNKDKLNQEFRDFVQSILSEKERGARIKMEDFWRKMKKGGAKLPPSEDLITIILNLIGSEKVYGLHDMELMMLFSYSLVFKQLAQLALVAENMKEET